MEAMTLTTRVQKLGTYILVGAAASIVLAACSTTPTPEATTQPETTTEEAMQSPEGSTAPAVDSTEGTMEGDVRVVDIEGGAFYYKPNEIRVKKGEKVKIVMASKDMMHDFVIDELKVKMPIAKGGETGTVEFTADKAGTYEFYCSVGEHRKNGQVGTLIVEE